MLIVLAEASNLSFFICVGAFVLVLAGIMAVMYIAIQREKDPEIPLDEVPQAIRQVVERLVPTFQARKIFVKLGEKKVPRKYEFHGDVNGNSIVVEVKPRSSPPYIKEVEVIYEPSYRRLQDGELIELAAVPAEVMEAALDHMDRIGSTVNQVDQARIGTIFDERAYELKGSWKNGRFEMKVLGTGAVIKVELRFPKQAGM